MGVIESIVESVKDIEGWLTLDEATLLTHTAINRLVGSELLTRESWVEIGSYCGKSTCLLGQVIQQRTGAPIILYAIDPHEGELTYPGSFDSDGRKLPRELNDSTPSTFHRYLENIKRFNLLFTVMEWVMTSESAAYIWSEYHSQDQISLIFIDGLHDYDSVKADYEHFQPYLAPGAIVAWHDNDWSGVHQCITEKVNAGEIEILAQADSLVISKYIKEKSE